MTPGQSKTMPDGTTRFCGVAVFNSAEGAREFPCVLKPGHDGFCSFGPEWERRF